MSWPTGEQSNSANTVKAVAPRLVWVTLLDRLPCGAGVPPVPVTARHSSYRRPPPPQRSIQVTPCCQCGPVSASDGCCAASHRKFGSGVNEGPLMICRKPATAHPPFGPVGCGWGRGSDLGAAHADGEVAADVEVDCVEPGGVTDLSDQVALLGPQRAEVVLRVQDAVTDHSEVELEARAVQERTRRVQHEV